MIIFMTILLLLILVVLFVLYLNEKSKSVRYDKMREIMNKSQNFEVHNVFLSTNTDSFNLTISSTYNLHTYALYYVDRDDNINNININAQSSKISLDFGNYSDAKFIIGYILLKKSIGHV